MATTTATTTTTPKAGMGNSAPLAGPVVPANLAGVVAPPTTTTPPVAAPKAKATPKAGTKPTTTPKATRTAKAVPAAPQPTRSAAAATRNQATQAMVLAWLTAHAGTAYSVNQVEIGTGHGPGTAGVQTLRPALWALVHQGLAQGPATGLRNSLGHKGFMVPKPTTTPRAATGKASAKPASK